MKTAKVLVIGGGIGGLTSAIALCKRGFDVVVIERDPEWSVYGVGIIQQSNVIRAVSELGILDDYLDAGFGFDHVDVFLPDGSHAVKLTSPKLTDGYPANVGISRRALHKVLGDRAKDAGADIRLGLVVASLKDDGAGLDVTFSDGTIGRFDLAIGADGLYSTTRQMIMPEIAGPAFTGQSVWRYNFERSADVTSLCAYEGDIGTGLVPLSATLMYMYVTTPEPGNPRHPQDRLASLMRERLAGTAPRIAELASRITENDEVVYKPLETLFVEGDWHRGCVVLLGDAVHATTPHLGQGAGMAIEDSLVLADELVRADSAEQAFRAFRDRRIDRCRFIVETSLALCRSQLGLGPKLDQATVTHEMFEITAQPL